MFLFEIKVSSSILRGIERLHLEYSQVELRERFLLRKQNISRKQATKQVR